MNSTKLLKQFILPLIAAFIWGSAFVAQELVGNNLGFFTFNAVRSLMAVIFLLIVTPFFKATIPALFITEKTNQHVKRDIFVGGICCGVCLTLAANFQQASIFGGTEAGKAGFINAMYIVFVPLFGVFFKKHTTLQIWISVFIAIIGLYFLCVPKTSFSVRASDLLCLICSFFYCSQILSVDYFSPRVPGIKLSCAQFVVCSLISFICAFLFEDVQISVIMSCIKPLLYCGVLSGGIAYTLQIIAQENSNPTVVSLILSTESVFSVICGAVFLHAVMTGREYFGCFLVFIAAILSQIPIIQLKKK